MASKALLVLLCSVVVLGVVAKKGTPLEQYVNNGDYSYDFTTMASVRGSSYTAFFLNLTSQTWLTSAESSKPVWTHRLTVCVPDIVSFKSAFLYIDGGSNTVADLTSTTVDSVTNFLCQRTDAVTAQLKQVPNQPVTFASDATHTPKTEDAIIAYTWQHFLQNTSSDPDWVLQFPQVKSAIRAMDAIQEFVETLDIPQVKSFVMCGASKRGWTTWLAAGIDKRVEAFIPIVMPILNITPNLDSAFRSLGGWSWTFGDYFLAGNMNYFNTPAFDALASLIDPINYNSKFTPKPTYIIAASQDEFFQPDSANFFFKDLRGEKYLRILPKADHAFHLTFNLTDVLVSIDTFFHMAVDNLRGPRDLNWNLVKTTSRTEDASIIAVSGTQPKKVVMYSTNTISTTQRDFRLFACITASGSGCYQGLIWNATEVTPQYGAIYTATRKAPAQGWGMFFLEFTYEVAEHGWNGAKREFKVTTEVNIVPDIFPYSSCGNACGLGQVNLANPTAQ
jgi:PhoPQ-activated pathogenicity-related protein